MRPWVCVRNWDAFYLGFVPGHGLLALPVSVSVGFGVKSPRTEFVSLCAASVVDIVNAYDTHIHTVASIFDMKIVVCVCMCVFVVSDALDDDDVGRICACVFFIMRSFLPVRVTTRRRAMNISFLELSVAIHTKYKIQRRTRRVLQAKRRRRHHCPSSSIKQDISHSRINRQRTRECSDIIKPRQRPPKRPIVCIV